MTPDWFTSAIQQTPQHHFIEVLNQPIHCQTWDDDNLQADIGLLFIHGHAAHAHWWDFIAPSFRQRFRVGAMDLSGNGDSGHRSQYSASQFSAEISACAQWLAPRTIVVAHSFGGSMARIAAHLHPDSFAGLILVDSVISSQRRESPIPSDVPPPKVRHYESLEQAARRFRLRPPQPKPELYILDYIARHSVKQVAEGYQFKLDPQVFDKMWPEKQPLPDGVSMVQNLKLPCAYIYGEQSRFCPAEVIEKLATVFPPEYFVKIEDAYHHLFLDQPLAFIRALEQLLKRMSEEI